MLYQSENYLSGVSGDLAVASVAPASITFLDLETSTLFVSTQQFFPHGHPISLSDLLLIMFPSFVIRK